MFVKKKEFKELVANTKLQVTMAMEAGLKDSLEKANLFTSK
jgi:hypothetical protein